MLGLGSIAFLNPWVLAGLVALPILWWLLRAIPPTPRRQAFAAVRLLLGLEDREREADKTPLWLLLLRITALAAAFIGFAQPVLNPASRVIDGRDGPLLLVMDQGWASAPDWEARRAAAVSAIDEAREADRPVMFWPLGDLALGGPLPPVASSEAVRPALAGLEPASWAPDRTRLATALADGEIPVPGQTIWFHDGLDHDGETSRLAEALAAAGPLRLIGPADSVHAVVPPRLDEGRLAVGVRRVPGEPETVGVAAIAEAPTGAERRIAVADAVFEAEAGAADAVFDLPPEILREVTRVIVTERPSAGGAALATGAIRRVPVGVVDPGRDAAVVSLTSASHYLRKALLPFADVREGTLTEMLDAEPAALVLADYGAIGEADRARLTTWIEEEGGLLIRFAGPRLAASISDRMGTGAVVAEEDALLPVRLRRGGRVLGGALAWTTPRRFGPFDPEGVFRRLEAKAEVEVRTQVLAEPSPELARRVWASLDDGTPLVTAKTLGSGHVVLFHVTADAEWSSLPISGLFVEMLGRLLALAPGHAPAAPEDGALADTLWRADLTIGPRGVPAQPSGASDTVAGELLADLRAGPGIPPGLYARADRGERRAGEPTELVISLFREDDALAASPPPPSGTVVETLGGTEPVRFAAAFLTLALLLALADVIGTLWVTGRLSGGLGRHTARGTAVGVLLLAAAMAPGEARAQAVSPTDRAAVEATAETTLGFVRTGDQRIDRISARALFGLGFTLTQRTAVEPGPPVGVDPETDELGFFAVLYWPLTNDTVPSPTALSNLSDYIDGGGMLLIDTQNGASGFGAASAAQMRAIARALNLPPLAPVDQDHVLSRAFYLLDRFPGRWRGGRVWAEAAPARDPVESQADIPQFDRIDDNVSPVIVGSADWAAAWAMDTRGNFMFPIGRAGDRQREMALRFGVNLVLYALTGNYKSDQVHAPEVLRRLGQ
ncbi:MAG: DUF4159 domain-containing protein [Pseudomonadota bacterium]